MISVANLAAGTTVTQPVGGGKVVDYTWDDVVGQASRMASHLRAQGFGPGAKIAILSKNCAHFVMAELAIWMAGGTTVAIFPTETAEIVRFVLEDSGASLLFVGKLDIWPQQASAVPASRVCSARGRPPARARMMGTPALSSVCICRLKSSAASRPTALRRQRRRR